MEPRVSRTLHSSKPVHSKPWHYRVLSRQSPILAGFPRRTCKPLIQSILTRVFPSFTKVFTHFSRIFTNEPILLSCEPLVQSNQSRVLSSITHV